RYVTSRRSSPTAAADDEFVRTWHHAALALLQQHGLVVYEERYLEGLLPPPASAVERLTLAYGIAQEQRCWNDRLDLSQAGDASEAVTRASGKGSTNRDGVAGSALATARERQQMCWQDALTRFAAAFSNQGTSAEAHVRSAWILFQLGRPKDALGALEDV